MFYQLFIFSLFFSFISLFLSFFLPFLFFLIPFSSSELWDFTTLFCIVLGCYSYMFKKKGLRHRRRSAEFQAQLPVRYLSGDSKFKPKSMPAVDSKFKPKSMPAVDSKFKPKSMPAVQRISYLDSVRGRAWRRSGTWRRSDRRHARGVKSFSYPRSDRTGVGGAGWDCESGDLDSVGRERDLYRNFDWI